VGTVSAVEIPEVITCVDCGGEAHLLSPPPEIGGWQPGDIAAYRCRDCLDRWDIEVGEDISE
jgi:hypothetical protein